jgi:thiosulfate/3-mercaptopyruvate sulfurtransferase
MIEPSNRLAMRTIRTLLLCLITIATPLVAQHVPVAPAPTPPAPAENSSLLVTGAWLAEHLESQSLVILHVGRDDETYRAGHVPGARFLPLPSILAEQDDLHTELPPIEALVDALEGVGVSNGSHVVLYGDLEGLAATRAFLTLDFLGHPKVSILDGGLDRWVRAGRSISTEPPPPARGSLTPRPRRERIVTVDWLREHLGSSAITLIDARPDSEFRGVEAGRGVPRPGHIPLARNVPWRSTLRGETDLRLRDPGSLRSIFRAAGAVPGRTVIVYCRTGLQASHSYFVARYLGYDVRLYDGSFLEWSRSEELPVVR